jgi:hypothetical protein
MNVDDEYEIMPKERGKRKMHKKFLSKCLKKEDNCKDTLKVILNVIG